MSTSQPPTPKRSRPKARERRQATPYHRGHTLGLTAMRALVGGLFVGHGSQKLFGSFGGPGLDATAAGFESMGMKPGREMAIAAGASELVGGSLLAVGAATPLAAAMLTGTMATAVERVHLKNGIWVTKGGFEYNVVLMGTVLALADAGPGKISLDHLRGRERRGLGWAIFELALGLTGWAVLRTWLNRRLAIEQEEASEVPDPSASDATAGSPQGASGAESGAESQTEDGSEEKATSKARV